MIFCMLHSPALELKGDAFNTELVFMSKEFGVTRR